MIIDGKAQRDAILSSLKQRVKALPFVPTFCDVLVGNDPASVQYVEMKEAIAEGLGIRTHHARFSDDISTDDLISEIKRIAGLPDMAGLIIQLPLPEHIDRDRVLNAVPMHLDVDALGEEASSRFYTNDPIFLFPTAAAVMTILNSIDVDLSNKSVVMVGRGMLVGRPVAHLLKENKVHVLSVDSDTEDPLDYFANADVLISAVGKENLITGEMIKPGAIVIDAGTSESNGGVVGDVERDSVAAVAGVFSPVPGGVGPVTVAMLMQNVVIAAERSIL